MHSPEPWRIEVEGLSSGVLVDANGGFVAGYSSDEGAFSFNDPNYQRIVACVNALAGIQDPAAFMREVHSLVYAVKSSRLLTTPSLQACCDEVLKHRQMEIPS